MAMKVELRRDVMLRRTESDLWEPVRIARRVVDMPCAPQVGWSVVIGSDPEQAAVEKVTFVVRTGMLHALLQSILATDQQGVEAAVGELEGQDYKVEIVGREGSEDGR